MPRLRLDPTSPSGVSIVAEALPVVGRQNTGYVVNKATGLISPGTNVTFTGNGTPENPYVISATGGGGGGGGSDTWGAITGTLSDQTDLQSALDAKATDTAVVHTTGTESIAGDKTFNDTVSLVTGGADVTLGQESSIFHILDNANTGIILKGDGNVSFRDSSNADRMAIGSDISFFDHPLGGVGEPRVGVGNDAATKNYVDTQIVTWSPYYDVVNGYGAVGDGVTDDSAAIQAAINDAVAAGGGTVYLQSRTFLIGTTLTIAGDNVTILGDSWRSTLKSPVSFNSYLITIDDTTVRKGLVFKNLKLDGNRLDQSSGGGITGAAASSVFEHVWFTACKTTSLNLTGTAASVYAYTNTVTECLFDNVTATHISMVNSDENNINNNIFTESTTQSIYDNAGGQIISNNVFVGGSASTTGIGVYVTGTANTIISHNVFDGPHEEAIKANASNVTITNNRISKVSGGTTSKAAINVLSGSHNTVTGNNVTGGAYYTYALDASTATYTQVSDNYFETGTSGIQTIHSTTQGMAYLGANTGFGTLAPAEKLDVLGNLQLKDADTATKAYRFRTTSADLDFEWAGDNMYLSAWANANFSGTHTFYLGFDTAGNADAFGKWYFHTAPFATIMMTVDSTDTTTPLKIHGGLKMDGATSGTTSLVPTAVAGTTTLTLPAATDTLVGKATTDVLTNKDLTSGTNTFPTLNQNTTGSAAKWTTARNLAGNSVDGSAAVPFANKFIVQGTTDSGLSAAQFLGALGTGLVKNTTTTGVLSIATAGTDYVVPGGALGTPSSGTLTNATGLPISGLTSSTSTALGVGSIELGNASDTTLTRVSAGVVAIEGVNISTVSSTATLTNKRITPRTGTTTSSATPTINTDNVDFYSLTAQAVDITSFTTNLSGTPTEGQKLWIAITGTAARAITWGASFEASTTALPTTTVTTNRLDVGFIWNTVTSKWRCMATG